MTGTLLLAGILGKLGEIETRRKAESKWIPTHGADLSGHDFGCEWVWAAWKGDKQLTVVNVRTMGPRQWEAVTHYMPTTFRTPSPPEGSSDG